MSDGPKYVNIKTETKHIKVSVYKFEIKLDSQDLIKEWEEKFEQEFRHESFIEDLYCHGIDFIQVMENQLVEELNKDIQKQIQKDIENLSFNNKI